MRACASLCSTSHGLAQVRVPRAAPLSALSSALSAVFSLQRAQSLHSALSSAPSSALSNAATSALSSILLSALCVEGRRPLALHHPSPSAPTMATPSAETITSVTDGLSPISNSADGGQNEALLSHHKLALAAAPSVWAQPSWGRGWRTMWTDSLRLGSGFHRETGTVADVAITYKPLAEKEPKWTRNPRMTVGVLEDSSVFSDVLTQQGALSLEGWGAAAEVTLRAANLEELDPHTVTAVFSALHSSENIEAINPANAEQEVNLTPAAAALLAEGGPVEFHQKHGSHFVCGYTLGDASWVDTAWSLRAPSMPWPV